MGHSGSDPTAWPPPPPWRSVCARPSGQRGACALKSHAFQGPQGTRLPPPLPPPEACGGGGRKPRLTGGHEWPVPSSPSSSHWGRAAGQSRQPPPSPGQAAGVCVGSGGSSQAAHAPSTSVRALSHTPPPVLAGPVQRSPQIHSEGSPGTWMRPLCLLFQSGVLSPAPREAAPTPPPRTGARSQVRVSLATRDVGWLGKLQLRSDARSLPGPGQLCGGGGLWRPRAAVDSLSLILLTRPLPPSPKWPWRDPEPPWVLVAIPGPRTCVSLAHPAVRAAAPGQGSGRRGSGVPSRRGQGSSRKAA